MKKFIIILLCVTGIITWMMLINSCSKNSEHRHETPAESRKQKALYHCPMHPAYTSDKPGECPICGMTLVPVEEEKTEDRGQRTDDRITIKISPEKQQIIGVKTGLVERRTLHKTIKTVGRVDYVESELSFVNTKFEGWIEKLYVDYTGQMVKKGQQLAEIYSPELVSTQQEYLLAYRAQKYEKKEGVTDIISSNVSILESARQRLKLWDITEDQIKLLEERGEIRRTLTIYSPVNGFVIEKNVIQGQRIMAGENLYKIADISRVWIYGDIYEYEVPLVKINQEAKITLSYFPGEAFTGKVSYIYPYLNTETRTNRIRIEVDNPYFKLKPGMYANLEIHVDYGTKLTIPQEALLDSGERKYVFVDIGDGYFEPREVKLGISTDDYYEVVEGVSEGERVVTSATFLIDSESSLKAAIEQMGGIEDREQRREHKH